jgi:hypothetical protein
VDLTWGERETVVVCVLVGGWALVVVGVEEHGVGVAVVVAVVFVHDLCDTEKKPCPSMIGCCNPFVIDQQLQQLYDCDVFGCLVSFFLGVVFGLPYRVVSVLSGIRP